MIQNVTIGFSTTRKWISAVIRWVTGSPVSHAWIAFDDPSIGLRMVLQAEAWGVELRPWDRWSKENVARAELTVGYELAPIKLVDLIKGALGARYDWKSAGLVGVARWVRRWVASRFSLRVSRTPGRLMCAEVVAVYLDMLGWKHAGIDVELTSPIELYEMALTDPRLVLKWRHESMPFRGK